MIPNHMKTCVKGIPVSRTADEGITRTVADRCDPESPWPTMPDGSP